MILANSNVYVNVVLMEQFVKTTKVRLENNFLLKLVLKNDFIIFLIFIVLNACTTSTCLNNGICKNDINGNFKCLCRPSFSGPNCQCKF